MSSALDPNFAGALCAHPDDAVDGQGSPAGGGEHGHHSCCPICAPAHSNIAPLVVAIVALIFAPAAPPRRIAPTIAASIPPALWIVLSARPRAPPAFS
ncbi:DUF2946 family protein [Methylocapsa polymorpha]|uniref:DUF2946 family protein n=1 Tax=Methylocapsa polymorpha TaxID=3080828 RepID=A0ABZ0HQC7_9HYPH|nr:DUF2946 family protein [Methylocapsa sp. RX1]